MAKHFEQGTIYKNKKPFSKGKIMDNYAASRIGQQLGNYRLLRLLGQGGFADVYLGEHLYLKTHAALKLLRIQLTNNALQDFLNEARTIARLEHPHIVRVLECGVERHTPFLVMNYAPNGTLRQQYPRGSRLPLEVVVSYVQQVASALDYAHQAKLIHRDIKPENMLLGRANEVLLSDFGLVLIAQSSGSQTMKEMAGTVPYMAPEQLKGKPRPASDQYALGIVVYEWLAGERPFQGAFAEIASQHLLTPPPPLHGRISGVSSTVESVVFKALAKDAQERFATVQEFAIALEQATPTVQRPLFKAPLTPPPPSIVLQSTNEMDLAISSSLSLSSISADIPIDGSSQPISTVTSSSSQQPLPGTSYTWNQPSQPMSTLTPLSLPSRPTTHIPADVPSQSTRILTPSDQSTMQLGTSLLSNSPSVDSPSFKPGQFTQTPLPKEFPPEQKPKRKGSVKAKVIALIVLALVVILGSVGLLYHPALLSMPPSTTPGATGTISQSQTTGVSPLPTHTTTVVHPSSTPGTQVPRTTTTVPPSSTPTQPNQPVGKWTFPTGFSVLSSPTVVGGVVYIGSDDGKVYAIDASTGQKMWAFATSGPVESSPTVVGGVLYIGSDDFNVYAINASTGQKMWAFLTGSYVLSSPAVVNGVVYVGSQDHNVYAINASTGQKMWAFLMGDVADMSSPTVVGGVLYIGSHDHNVYAINASTGQKMWAFATGGWVVSSPMVVNGVVYVGSDNGGENVYAINASTGQEIWHFSMGAPRTPRRWWLVGPSTSVTTVVMYMPSMLQRVETSGPRPLLLGTRCTVSQQWSMVSFTSALWITTSMRSTLQLGERSGSIQPLTKWITLHQRWTREYSILVPLMARCML